jgi:hypothetical protein
MDMASPQSNFYGSMMRRTQALRKPPTDAAQTPLASPNALPEARSQSACLSARCHREMMRDAKMAP